MAVVGSCGARAATCTLAHLCVRLVQRLDDLCWWGLLPLEDLGLHLTPELLTRLGWGDVLVELMMTMMVWGQLVRWGGGGGHKGVRRPSILHTKHSACSAWRHAGCRFHTCLLLPWPGRTDTWSAVRMHAERTDQQLPVHRRAPSPCCLKPKTQTLTPNPGAVDPTPRHPPVPLGPAHTRQCAPTGCTWHQPGARPWTSGLQRSTGTGQEQGSAVYGEQ